jgi:hypothetical protein
MWHVNEMWNKLGFPMTISRFTRCQLLAISICLLTLCSSIAEFYTSILALVFALELFMFLQIRLLESPVLTSFNILKTLASNVVKKKLFSINFSFYRQCKNSQNSNLEKAALFFAIYGMKEII